VTPEVVQVDLRILKELRPISSLAITNIDTNYLFNYVPDDFLVGATQRGLVNFPITADKVPRLSELTKKSSGM